MKTKKQISAEVDKAIANGLIASEDRNYEIQEAVDYEIYELQDLLDNEDISYKQFVDRMKLLTNI